MPKEQRRRIWLAVAGSSTILLGTVYVLVQQATRLAVDDLPLSTAQVVKIQLESGTAPADVIPPVKTDLKKQTALFVSITDADRNLLATSASLNGKPSLPPKGTFDYTAKHGTDRFTWQPADGVRLATRMLPYNHEGTKGFIVAGQSLSQAEKRITTYGLFVLAAWMVILAWTFMALWFPL